MKKRTKLMLLASVPLLTLVIAASAAAAINIPQPGRIVSDGVTYPAKKIAAVEIAAEVDPGGGLPRIKNNAALLKLLHERGALYEEAAQNTAWLFRRGNGQSEVTADMATIENQSVPFAAAAAEAELSDGSFSQTNEQVAGVNEGDIVKTDGQYIYVMTQNMLHIVEAAGADMKTVSTIPLAGLQDHAAEFYLMGDRIAVLGTRYMDMSDAAMPGVWYGTRETAVTVYDISDRSNPAEVRSVSMDGGAISSRVMGDIVYFVTNKHVYAPAARANSPLIMPHFSDSVVQRPLAPFAFDNMFYVPGTADHSFLMMGAIDVTRDDPFAPVAFLGAGQTMYMSQEAIYVAQTTWRNDSQNRPDRAWHSTYQTEIMRFAVEDALVSYVGKGVVDGETLNQYSMDEHKGYFRIATNTRGVGTFISVLDADTMQTVGATEPVEPREDMKSARFMGDMAYFVTFENTDPLFTIDLSDPYQPKVLGELKIPGFSEYLHPVGESLLLGIGRDTEELFSRDRNGNETVVGFRDAGIKASLFDVSDPFAPKEVNVLLFGMGWADVSHNPRALMVDKSRNLYGFLFQNWDDGIDTTAVLIQVSPAGLHEAQKFSVGNISNGRLLFIGSTLYLTHDKGIAARDYTTFKEVGALTFR